ncbi:MAG TPA: AsmA-like C-terminal region-containing protein, partial [Bacteroidia bacterium]|nr:AsmA-like C-terminal region-containing protein [Bacteroidia bacterium]
VLNISGDLSSGNINLDSLLAAKPTARKISPDSIYHLVLPERLKLNLNTAIRHVEFGKFEATDIAGTILLNNQRMTADPISFHSMDGSFSGSGMIDGTRGDSLLITCNADIKDVNIYKLFYELNNFGMGKDTAITYNNVRGVLTSNINFASLWGNDLNVNEKKIYTDADITIANGELINFKPLEVLSRFIKLDELKDIKFKSLHNNIEIKNRVINLPKMEINSSALNLTMSGTHNFDDTVDYHFIVDMDELLAKKWVSRKPQETEYGVEEDDGGHRTRIFLNMKGYLDDDNITHYDRKGAVQALKEDLHAEKQNLKSILHDEFGWFKGDKDKKDDKKDQKKENSGKFILQQDDSPKDKKKKSDDDLDSGDDYK